MPRKKKGKTKKPVVRSTTKRQKIAFHFSHEGVTIEAYTREEAEQILKRQK